MTIPIPEVTARAGKALAAAETLLAAGLHEDAVSRAYYAVLHAAKAALATRQIFPQSHHTVRRMVGLHLINTGLLEKEYATIMAAGQEDRELGDYDVGTDIAPDRAAQRVADARRFVTRVEAYLKSSNHPA